MNESLLITISRDDLKTMFLETLEAHDKSRNSQSDKNKTISINQAAKLIGISHDSAKRLINKGRLKTTVDQRRVLKTSVNEYLLQQ